MASQRGDSRRLQPPLRSIWQCLALRRRVGLWRLAALACVLAALSGARWPRAACSPPAGRESSPLAGSAAQRKRRWRFRWAETLQQWTQAVEGGVIPDGDFAQAAAEACHKGGRDCWEQALGVLKTLVLDDIPARTEIHNAVLGACARAAKWRNALSVLHDMFWNELEPDAVSFDHAMQALDEARIKDPEARDDVRGELKKLLAKSLASLERDPQPRMALYRTALRSCLRLSQWESVLQLLDSMRARSLDPDARMLLAAARGVQPGDVALRLLGQVWSASRTGAEDCRAAAETFRLGGAPQQTMDLLKETLRLQLPPDAVAYDAYIEACAELSIDAAIPKLLNKSVDAVLATCGTVPPDVAAFSAAMRSCGRCGQWDRALQLLAELARRGGDADARAFDAAIWACARGRQTVFPLLEEMQEWRLQPSASSVASAMCEHIVGNDTSSARALYLSSLKNVGLGVPWLTSAYSADLRALPMDAVPEAVRFLAEEIRRKQRWGTRAVVLTTGSGGGRGDVREARRKRLVEAVLSQEYGIAADSSENGFITLPAKELKSLVERFRSMGVEKKKKKRKKIKKMEPEDFAFRGWEDEAED